MKSWLASTLFIGCLSWSALAQAEIWQFGLIGDVPYTENERRELPRMLDHMAERKLAFIAHIGDFKSGRDRCDDSLFNDRYTLFNASQVPFIYVPGDNEWTDCDRTSSGSYDPLERLNALRNLFWRDAFSLGKQRLALEQQPGIYKEHARFRIGPVLFVTVNLPGGSNNRGMRDEPSAEYLARSPIVNNWIKENFSIARRDKLAGIVLLFQANPGFKYFAQGIPNQAYKDFLEILKQETLSFDGKVAVVHGDTHRSRIDHPLRDAQSKRLERFTRVETHGYPIMGWTRGTIDTDHPALFQFESYNWSDFKAQ